MSHDYKLKVMYGGVFKPVKTKLGRKYVYGMQTSYTVLSDTYTLKEFFEDMKKMWDWGETEYVQLVYKSKKIKGEAQRFIDIKGESDFLSMLEQFTDGTEIEIYITISPSGIPFDLGDEGVAEGEDDTRIGDEGEEHAIGDEGEEDPIGDEAEAEAGNEAEAEAEAEPETEAGALAEAGAETEASAEAESSAEAEAEAEADFVESDGSDFVGDDFVESNLVYTTSEDDSNVDELVFDEDNPEMRYGVKYPDVTSFRSALNEFAIQNQFEYKVIKSDRCRVTARCRTKGCGWRIHAARIRGEDVFQVKTFQPEHTCEVVNRSGNKNASQGWIANRISSWLKNEGDISVPELTRRLKEKYGRLELPYLRVWKGKEEAKQRLYGKWELSFSTVFDFCGEIRRRNVGSHTSIKLIEVNGKQHFQRMFIAFGASIQGFLRGCRPYIGLDGAHLKGKFKGVIVSAIALDGNNAMFPVAYGVVESENAESWEWFLLGLKEAIWCPNGFVLSSDRQKGLDKALLAVYPTAEHRECMRHLYSNVKKRFRSDVLKKHLWGAARAYTTSTFQYHMDRVKNAHPTLADFLRENHGHIWSRSLFGLDAKCERETNNICETFNSWISEERNRPVIDMMDAIRQKLMIMMNKRARVARKWSTKLVPEANKHINKLTKDVGNFRVLRCTDQQAEAEGPNQRCDVRLDERTCTCRRWQVSGLPCVHAIAFLAKMKLKPEYYTSSYFTVERYRDTYALNIKPLPAVEDWIPSDVGFSVLPPILARPAGRPRKKRIRGAGEIVKRIHKCKRCGGFGHHAKRCRNEVPTLDPTTQSSSKRRRKDSGSQRQVQDEHHAAGPSAGGASAAGASAAAASAAGPSAAEPSAAGASAAGALAEWTSAEWPSAEWASPAAGASAGASAWASAGASAAGGQSSSQRRRKGSGTRRQQQHATAAPAASQTSSKKRRNNSGLHRGQDLQAAASGASQQQHEAIPYSQQGSTISDIDARRLLG